MFNFYEWVFENLHFDIVKKQISKCIQEMILTVAKILYYKLKHQFNSWADFDNINNKHALSKLVFKRHTATSLLNYDLTDLKYYHKYIATNFWKHQFWSRCIYSIKFHSLFFMGKNACSLLWLSHALSYFICIDFLDRMKKIYKESTFLKFLEVA